MEQNIHLPVLAKEVLNFLLTDPKGTYIDCTAGGGGHIKALLDASFGQARVIGLDKDGLILDETRKRLEKLLG